MVAGSASAGRPRRGWLDFAFGNPLYRLTLGRSQPRTLRLVPPDPWPGDARHGAAMLGGVYRFAGEVVQAHNPPWLPLGAGDDFVAEWNGFEWLRDLRAVGGDEARRHARRLVASWVERQDRWHPMAWRPDVLGRRVSSWIATHDFFCASADDTFRSRVFASLARQVCHLYRALPGPLAGAPLIAALKGLIYGGLALPGGERRQVTGLRLLDRELDRQVPADGIQIQRNPLLQLGVLRDLVDLRAALRAAQAQGEGAVEPPQFLHDAIDRMGPALRFLRHGDGGLALFNGGREGDPALIDAVLTQADSRSRPFRSAPHGGYERLAAGRTLILMDAGPPPPPGFDADFHAGALSFEMSVGRERLIVNCGAWPGRFGREAAVWHDALRGTAAHSTLTLADTGSRPLDPARAQAARRNGAIGAERHEQAGAAVVDAAHDFYRAAFGVAHRRRLFLGDQGDDLRGEDTLTIDPGRAATALPFAIRFHLHPAVTATLAPEGHAALLRLGSGGVWRMRATGGSLAIEESVYVGQGEERQRTRQLVIAGTVGGSKQAEGSESRPGPVVVKWALKRDKG